MAMKSDFSNNLWYVIISKTRASAVGATKSHRVMNPKIVDCERALAIPRWLRPLHRACVWEP